MMPTALLSGMIFPITSMPGWLQPVTRIVPARWFIVIARGIMLKGIGLEYLWRETADARAAWRCCSWWRRSRSFQAAARLTCASLRFLLRKEFLQIFRDRFMVAQMLLLPFIQLAILANAATFEVKRARLVVVDEDRTPMLARLVVTGSRPRDGSSWRDAPSRRAAPTRRCCGAKRGVILRVPGGLRARPRARRAPRAVQLVLNAEDGAAAGVTLGYAQRIIADYAGELATTLHAAPVPIRRAARRGRPTLDVRTRGWYNPELDYRYYMVPGILVQLVTIVGTLLTAHEHRAREGARHARAAQRHARSRAASSSPRS